MMWLLILLGLVGVYLSVFGFRLLFEKGYVERLEKTTWKGTDEQLGKSKGMHIYNKYFRGGAYLVVGLMFVGFVLLNLLNR